jgi:hypothetical protein
MAKLNTVAKSATHSVLIYGDAKTGKTQLAGTLAAGFNLLWFDLENGFETLLKLPEEQQSRIELLSLPDTKDYPIAVETMLKVFSGKPMHVCEAHGKVNCPACGAMQAGKYVPKQDAPSVFVHLDSLTPETIVVVDSLTQLSNSAMAHITRKQDTEYKPTWEDYANQGAVLAKFLSYIQAANYNVLCITHVIESEMEDGKKKLSPLCGTRNLSSTTAKYFGHVLYTEVKNLKHVAGSMTGYANNIQTGSRTDVDTVKGDTLVDLFSNTAGARTTETGAKATPATSSSANPNQVALAKLAAAKLAATKATTGV